MKRLLNIACTIAMLTLSVMTTSCTNQTDESMRTEMTSEEYVTEMGIGINLGNTMESFWEDKSNQCSGSAIIGENSPSNYETCWGAISTTQEIIDGIKASGFSTVRVPVYWGNMMLDDGTFTINEEYFERVDEIIQYCLNDGLYVVINVHHYDEYIIKNFPKEQAIEITEIIWTQIAKHYRNYSDYLIFEGFNENLGSCMDSDAYTDDELYTYVNDMNQTFVDIVRATGGNNTNRMLIVSGYWTNIDLTTDSRFIIPTDSVSDRIMVSVHYIDNSIYWNNAIGTGYWYKYSIEQCNLLKEAFTDNGIQVFVGECTANYDEHISSESEYTSSECLQILLDIATDYGFIPVIWDTNGGMYSRIDCTIESEDDKKVINSISEKIANTVD